MSIAAIFFIGLALIILAFFAWKAKFGARRASTRPSDGRNPYPSEVER
jgi:hypothetical protein